MVCKPPPPGAKNEVCALVQSVTAEDRNNIGLTVYFQKFSDGKRVLRVFAPLGVLLPPGLGLKIDDKDVGHAPFVRCHNFACYAQIIVEEQLIEQLKNGKTAVFIIFQTEEAGIGIPISLAGFGQALAALTEVGQPRAGAPAFARQRPAISPFCHATKQRWLAGACTSCDNKNDGRKGQLREHACMRPAELRRQRRLDAFHPTIAAASAS